MYRINLLILLVMLFCACNDAANSEKANSEVKAAAMGCAPKATDKDWYTSGKKAPLFDNLKGIEFKISTTSKEAQDYFNQGMMLAYGFNHAEAARSFYEATRLDSSCAMAFWGYAYVLGPNYNAGMESDNYERAFAAVSKAQSLKSNCTAKEIALIDALSTRYTEQAPADRQPLDIAYSAAMKKVYGQYPDDPDIGALYGESLMDIHPWDLYDKKTKAPKSWTPELLAILEHLMKKSPGHPGAHHFYIHALEASATPEKALPSARSLDTLVPGAGHLVHMPSHIYINTGDYHYGTLSNQRAVEADSVYTTACHAQGAYPLAYYPHNYHFLAATAALEGDSKTAWAAARKLQEHTSIELMQKPEWGTLQHYFSIPFYMAVKFRIWDTILSLPPLPANNLVYPEAIAHYAKGMAYLGKKDTTSAQKELSMLQQAAADTSLQQLSIWGINTAGDLVQIALNVLSAEMAEAKNQTETAIRLLNEAVQMEDKLNYNEPPDWFFSVRHHLGDVLLKAGKYKEAENVYRQDLKTWKKNGWALIGLYNALIAQKKDTEAKNVKAQFDEAWKYADIKITSSRG